LTVSVRAAWPWSGAHLVVHRIVFQPGTTITQQRRLALLRRYVTDNPTGNNASGDAVPLPIRVAVCLLLLSTPNH